MIALALMPVVLVVGVLVPVRLMRRAGADLGHVGGTWLLALLLGCLVLGVSLMLGLWPAVVLVPLAAWLATVVTGRRTRATVTVSAFGAAAPSALCMPVLIAFVVCWNTV